MSDAELIPCPFCDGEAHIDEVQGVMNEVRFSPTCENALCLLYCVPRSFNTRAEAAEAFNTRAPVQVKHQRIETWFIHDGDMPGLEEFAENLEWSYYCKGGKDRKNYHLVFLRDETDATVAAIRCKAMKDYMQALEYLRRIEDDE